MKVKRSGIYKILKKNKWHELAECECCCCFKVKTKNIVEVELTEVLSGCGFAATTRHLVLLKAICPECKESVYVASIDKKVMDKLADDLGVAQEEGENDDSGSSAAMA